MTKLHTKKVKSFKTNILMAWLQITVKTFFSWGEN